MGRTTKIQWTDRTCNPIRARHKKTGKLGWHCVKFSPGCAHCYAEMLNLWRGTGLKFTAASAEDLEIVLDLGRLEDVCRRRDPSKIFLCDMTDLFADFVPMEWLDAIFDVIAGAPHHIFQVLTKRAIRARSYFKAGRKVPANAWIGASIEDRKQAEKRVDELRGIDAAVRFVSIEPLLEDLGPHLSLQGIQWAIVGGESGSRARPCDIEWIRTVVDRCSTLEVPCFVKQLGSVVEANDSIDAADAFPKKVRLSQGSLAHYNARVHLVDPKGGDPEEWPRYLQVREFPTCIPSL